jgi:L-amino acid N-acyltransferase YncA
MTALPDQLTVHPAQTEDLSRVAEIYNAGIAERVATFETSHRTIADISGWVEDGQPFIVAIDDEQVIGWARAGAYSDRCVYQGVGEHAAYVHPEARGRRLGRTLLIELCAESERRGCTSSPAGCSPTTDRSGPPTAPPDFEEVGIQRRHGKLDGQWKDCVLVEHLLGPAAD